MIATVDIEVNKIILSARDAVRDTVKRSLGPSDPTIVVEQLDAEQEEDVDVDELLDAVEQFGQVVLIR